MTPSEPRYLDVDGVAAYLSMSSKAIRRLVDKAHIPNTRVGRAIRFDRCAIDTWMAKQVDRRKPQ